MGASLPGGTLSRTTCHTAPPRRTGCSGMSRPCSSSRRRRPSAPAPHPSPSCQTRRPRRSSASRRRRHTRRTTARPSHTRCHRPCWSPRRRRHHPGSPSSSFATWQGKVDRKDLYK